MSWHFHDLHGFKDFVSFVRLCAPDLFPEREGATLNEQWTLDLAFEGLRYGLKLIPEERSESEILARCQNLIENAYHLYRAEKIKEAYEKMQELEDLINKLPSH